VNCNFAPYVFTVETSEATFAILLHQVTLIGLEVDFSLHVLMSSECDRTLLKKQGFVSQDHIEGFSMKR
jgi:hypothetical protein